MLPHLTFIYPAQIHMLPYLHATGTHLSIPIHLLIIILILPGPDGLPPLLVIEIPVDRLLNAVLEHGLREPAQLAVDLGGIYGVALIMALAVCHVSDQALRLSEFLADELDDINVAHFIVSTDIVDFTDTSSAEDQIDRFAVILYIQPVSHIEAFSVYGERLIVTGRP